jgi:hypothetical protein
VYSRVLKSGRAVEAVQFEATARSTDCPAVDQIVARRVPFARRLGRACPGPPCGAASSGAEWRSVDRAAQRRPAPAVPRLGEVVRWVAELGGHLSRAGDGPPGPRTMWIGLQRVRGVAPAREALHHPDPKPKRCG